MLEYFFKAPYRLRQLRHKPLCRHIDVLATELRQLGFTRASGQRILWLTGKFNDFALSVGVENAQRINEWLVERFLKEQLTSSCSRRDARSAMQHLLEHLRDQGVIPKVVTADPADPFDPILNRYDCHLRDVRGLTLTSRSQYLRYARLLRSWLQNRHSDRPLSELTGGDVLEFVTELA
ncbi:hypothetical protein MYX65_09805 [Acidobacteria bacterium AH-259-L09]|nr:hypothetical protein [Acidobacteria bacterium AH-259-L09]